MEVVVQRKRSGAAGPGIKAWLHAGRDAITLSATSHRNFAHEVEQLLGRAQELRQAGQDEDADALLDKELATLTTLPFASLELLPLLLEAGQYNVALRVALAAYEMREKRLGRKDTATVLAGIPLGVALAAAHRHSEAQPLLRDGMAVAVQRMDQLDAIEAAVVRLGGTRGWCTKLMQWLYGKVNPVHVLWKCAGADASFHHGISQLVESRYELERHWKSASTQREVKRVLTLMTTFVSSLAQELGPEHTRVQVALREYDRVIEMSQLKRQRNLRHALQKHSRELRGVVETCRKQWAAQAALERQLYEAMQSNQERLVQELAQQLVVQHLRRKGVKI